MVWSFQVQRAAALLASVLFASVLLSGCVADDARTQLEWYPASDAVHHPRLASNQPPYHPAAAHRHVPHAAPVQTASLDCPTPRAKPSWYTTTSMPPPAAPVTQPATYAPPPTGSLAFAWPVTGPVISDYGASLSGERNAGINIATPFGAPIHAAAAGQISYAGNELRGYGNLVLIKHDDGYVTAYAHAERIIVGRGDFVAKGQVIGYSGQTGDVSSPQLHFEIRKGMQPVNPRSLLVATHSS